MYSEKGLHFLLYEWTVNLIGLCPMVRLFFENYIVSLLNIVTETFELLFEPVFRILSIPNSQNGGIEHEGVDVSDGLQLGGFVNNVIDLCTKLVSVLMAPLNFCDFLIDGGYLREGVKNILSNNDITAPGGKIIIALSHHLLQVIQSVS